MPTAAELIAPTNGEYVDGTVVNFTFYAPGVFGTACNPVTSLDYYQVHDCLFDYVNFSLYFIRLAEIPQL